MHRVGGSTITSVLNGMHDKFDMSIAIGESFNLDNVSEPFQRAINTRGINSHLDRKFSSINSYLDRSISQSKRGSFVFSWVRKPMDRCLSAFYWQKVTVNGEEPSDDNIVNFARSNCRLVSPFSLFSPHRKRAYCFVNFIHICEKTLESTQGFVPTAITTEMI